MGDWAVEKAQRSRSRLGCARCRKRRQKCDEAKPSCSRCAEKDELCTYEMNIRWGGRNFKGFDDLVMEKCHSGPGSFIYIPSEQKTTITPDRELGISMQPFISDKTQERILLHHFVHEASRITSCHPQIQVLFCQLILPMALNVPALFSALLALSAIHRASLYNSEASGGDIVAFKSSSILKLRNQLRDMSSSSRDAILATILMLCMCEIHSGADKPKSWRVHLQGAQAILGSQEDNIAENPTSTRSLLRRWFISIEALASLTANGLNAGQAGFASDSLMTAQSSSPPTFYLDDFFGYSTELVDAFQEIGAAACERQTAGSRSHGDSFVILSSHDFETEADLLENSMRERILRDQIMPPPFYDGVEENLDATTVIEFRMCNEAYQHAALIHILRRIRKIPKASHSVQCAVKNIVRCCKQIFPRTGLSPWIVLNMPLFTAGMEAMGDDRIAIKSMMVLLYDSLKLENIRRSLALLERCWSTQGDFELEVLQDENCDFIPY